MKLKPREGLDDLRFGDDLPKAVSLIGGKPEVRAHPEARSRTSAHFREKALSLSFDADGKLVFIAVLRGGPEAELWGDRPFEVARSASDLKAWIEQKGRHPAPHTDCLGMRYDVQEEGISFCLSPEDFETLEGIQLYVT